MILFICSSCEFRNHRKTFDYEHLNSSDENAVLDENDEEDTTNFNPLQGNSTDPEETDLEYSIDGEPDLEIDIEDPLETDDETHPILTEEPDTSLLN
ncbi:MAG: hypothetical protein MRY83_24435 [Flavobacteriales bacterium]|nr:hypothetical protein [Flavobacteriales bacterium]